MAPIPAKFPVLTALGSSRGGALREVAAAAVLLVIWAALWSWLILGVGMPAAAVVRHLSPPGPAAELALRRAEPGLHAP